MIERVIGRYRERLAFIHPFNAFISVTFKRSLKLYLHRPASPKVQFL